MQANVPVKLGEPVQRYLNALELELKQQVGVCPEEALSDAREYLQNAFDGMNRAEPGQTTDEIFDHFVDHFGQPIAIAESYAAGAQPFNHPAIGVAPGWRIYCTKCGRSAPAAKVGITRIGAFSKYKVTLGYCSDCRWIRFFRITMDLDTNSLTSP